jgi:hypothetical protein
MPPGRRRRQRRATSNRFAGAIHNALASSEGVVFEAIKASSVFRLQECAQSIQFMVKTRTKRGVTRRMAIGVAEVGIQSSTGD